MLYAIVTLLGVFVGGICAYVALEVRRRNVREQKRQLDAQAIQVRDSLSASAAREQELNELAAHLKTELAELDERVITYKELQGENTILKHDLQNIDVNLRKVQFDRDLQQESQEALDQRSKDLGSRYLKENVKWIGSSLTANNFVNCRQRLQKVIERCRGIGFDVSTQDEDTLLANLKEEFEKAVRAAFEREEQARIRSQIIGELKLEKEIERELKQLERERAAIQAALKKAIAEAKDEHSAEVERLKARLSEAEEKSRRAKSRAQMTKSGHVYVISNIGSFGEDVFKIGMTRRLEPMDRVKELGDASVPFRFDVHMMISSDDAPALENTLHRELHKLRLNKVNPRKEFFRTDVEAIRQLVEAHLGQVDYIADPEALEYRQSISMSDEEEEYIEHVYDQIDQVGRASTEDE